MQIENNDFLAEQQVTSRMNNLVGVCVTRGVVYVLREAEWVAHKSADDHIAASTHLLQCVIAWRSQ